MVKYKVGDYVSGRIWEPNDDIKYGKIVRIIGGSSLILRRYECLSDHDFDKDIENTFFIDDIDVDNELTIKMNRDRKLKELGI